MPKYGTRHGFSRPFCAPQVGHRRDGVGGHVLDPLHHLLRGAAADVARDVGVGAELLHEIHELVGAEAVVLDDAAPVGVDHRRALLARADAVLPVVLVGEAAAGPAQHGDVELLQGGDHVVADARGCSGWGSRVRPRCPRRCRGRGARRSGRRCSCSRPGPAGRRGGRRWPSCRRGRPWPGRARAPAGAPGQWRRRTFSRHGHWKSLGAKSLRSRRQVCHS